MTISPKTAADAPVITLSENVNKWYGDLNVARCQHAGRKARKPSSVAHPAPANRRAIRCTSNGREEHQEGRISVDGTNSATISAASDAIRRRVGMVFRNFNLFPHLDGARTISRLSDAAQGMRKDEAGCCNGAAAPGSHSRSGAQISRPAIRYSNSASQSPACSYSGQE